MLELCDALDRGADRDGAEPRRLVRPRSGRVIGGRAWKARKM
jgi:hypothetical protein